MFDLAWQDATPNSLYRSLLLSLMLSRRLSLMDVVGKDAMVFTNRLATRINLVVAATIVIMLSGAFVSLRMQDKRHEFANVQAVAVALDQLPAWDDLALTQTPLLPDLLQSHGIDALEITHDGRVQLSYQVPGSQLDDGHWREFLLPLPTHQDSVVRLQVASGSILPPWPDLLAWMGWQIPGIVLVLLVLRLLRSWFNAQLWPVELLAWRARQILQGQDARGRFGADQDKSERLVEALERLLTEVEQLRRERSRFDSFIRSSAFVDPLTGVGNRDYFLNRLEVAVRDQVGDGRGYLLVLSLTELDQIEQQSGSETSDELLLLTSDVLSHLLKRIEGAIHARYASNSFALLLPHGSEKEASELARQLLRTLQRLRLPPDIDSDTFFYVGGTAFRLIEPVEQLLEMAEQALRVARLQGPSGWHFHDNEDRPEAVEQRGSVRWRQLLEQVFEQRRITIFYQPVVGIRNNAKWYLELLPRIDDENGRHMTAHNWLPLADKVGMMRRLDRYMVEELISRLRRGSKLPLGINLSLASLQDSHIRTRLSYQLMQLPLRLRRKIVFEVTEEIISQHPDEVRQTLALLRGMGCRVAVDNAGKDVVSTQYVYDFKPDYLKLHPSLVRDLHLRPVNQLALRSLMGGCADSSAKLVAVGVESEEEWRVLKRLGVAAAQGFYVH